jgi:hypothetical protein
MFPASKLGRSEVPMRAFAIRVLPVVLLALLAPAAARSQQPAQAMDQEQLTTFAKAFIAIGKVRDEIQAELAKSGNKTEQAQKELQVKLRTQIEHVLHEHNLTEAEFLRRTQLISVNDDMRKTFDDAITRLTGQLTPAQQAAANAAAAAAARPATGAPGQQQPQQQSSNPHVNHVINAFNDTPNGRGLLPTALAEARTAIQHAGLAARNTSNLDAMKQHAGHVLHAVDPGTGTSGPSQGYGVKKAAMAVAAHIELAARVQGAAASVTQHASHVATSARNTVQRADRIAALVKQIQAATSATDAAALVNQLVSLTEQLIAGADTNADGRIGWQEGEGGLQHVEEHVNNILRG